MQAVVSCFAPDSLCVKIINLIFSAFRGIILKIKVKGCA